MRLSDIKTIFHKELDGIYPKEEVDSFFYMLIMHFLGLERFVLALQPLLTLSKEEEQPMFAALSDLKLQKPVQYIIGKAHFMEMDFIVNEAVLDSQAGNRRSAAIDLNRFECNPAARWPSQCLGYWNRNRLYRNRTCQDVSRCGGLRHRYF